MFYVFEELPVNMEEFIETSMSYMFFEDALENMGAGYVVDDYLDIVAFDDSHIQDVEVRDGVLTFWKPFDLDDLSGEREPVA